MISGNSPATFWILGSEYKSRVEDGLVYPDIVQASECIVVDGTIPANWKLANFHFINGERTIIGPPQFCSKGFLEDLTNGSPTAVRDFLSIVESIN